MKRLVVALFGVMMGTFVTLDAAEAARRLGGGKNLGAQRAAPMQRQAQPPAQQAQPAKPAAPAQAQAPAPQGSRWLAPLAGLAAGLGLGWLLAQGGFGDLLGGLLLALLAAVAVIVVLRLLARRRAETERPLQYAGVGNETVAAPPPSQMPMADGVAQRPAPVPAGFDAEGFLKQAKLNFIRVQQANDRSDLSALGEIVTDELFHSLKADIAARGGAAQQIEVVTLHASLLEVVTEGDTYWASVRFSGSIREEPTAQPEDFDEVWNLRKPLSGRTGWLLAGIQQVS